MFADFFIDNIPCISPKSLWGSLSQLNWPLHNHSEANGVYCYRGRRPSEAHLLVPKSFVDAMDQSVAHTIRISHDGGELSLPGWYVYKCEAAGQGDGTDGNQIFYLQLRDARQIACATCFTDPPGNITSTLRYITVGNETQPSTVDWADVLSDIWGKFPALAKADSSACPSLETTPSSYAENLTFEGLTVWKALCQALNACGHLPLLDPVTRVYSFVAWNSTQSGLTDVYAANLSSLVWDGLIESVPSTNYPDKVKIVFPPERNIYPNQVHWREANVEQVSTGVTGVIADTCWAIIDTTRKEYDSESAITNQAQMDDRVTDLTPYIKGMFLGVSTPTCRVYSKIVTGFRCGSQVSEVAWVNDRRGVYTRVSHHEEPVFELPGNYAEMWVPANLLDCVLAYTDSGATARSGTTLGSGSATLQKIVSGVVSDWESDGATPTDVTYYNLSTETVAAGYILLDREKITGQYIVVWEDCA